MINPRRQSLVHSRFQAYALDHARTLLFSLGKLCRTPWASLMTVAVIGIALALPSGLYVFLKNLQAITGTWGDTTQISLFLKSGTSLREMHAFAGQLRTRTDLTVRKLVDAEQALDEFRQQSGFGEALDSLDENPLPQVIIVNPTDTRQSAIKRLVEELSHLAEVDSAVLDMQWLQRLDTIMEIAKRTVTGIATMLAVAVLLIVGNTIRLDIHNRSNEIKIIKLAGATDGFVRRPFLYGGLWYGISGGIFAWIMIYLTLTFVEGPVKRLAKLYNSQFQLLGLDSLDTFIIVLLSGALGLAGSWLAVARHLSKIEPE